MAQIENLSIMSKTPQVVIVQQGENETVCEYMRMEFTMLGVFCVALQYKNQLHMTQWIIKVLSNIFIFNQLK